MAINNIEQVKWIVHKILPAVYDEALSYYEVLCKVIAKLNEVIANEDAQNEMLVGFDERLTDVEEAVSEIESDIRGEITDVLKTYNGYANGKFLGVSGDEIKWVNMPTVITSYDSLTDKPQINGVTLAGNKTSAQLNIKQIPAGGVVGQVLKKLSDNDYDVAWGSSGGGGGGGTTDYTDLENKPQINGVTLAGNKSTADLSLGDMKKADYDSDDAVDEAGGIAAYVDSAISTGTSGLMAEADYDSDEVVKDAGGIMPYVESKVVASVVQNFPEDSQFYVVMNDADDGEVASTVIFGKTVAVNQLITSLPSSNSSDGITWTKNDNTNGTINGTSTARKLIGSINCKITAGHTYYIKALHDITVHSGDWSITVLDEGIATATASNNSLAMEIMTTDKSFDNELVRPQIIDLNNSPVANRLTEIGTDVAKLKHIWLEEKGEPLPLYIPYDAGSLANVNGVYRVRGRNLWDEEWELGSINTTTGQNSTSDQYCRSKNYIPISESRNYYFKKPTGITTYLFFYDENKTFIQYTDPFQTTGSGGTFSIPSSTRFIRFMFRSTAYANDICINLYDASFNGQYEKAYNGGTIDCSTTPLNGVGTAQDEVDYAAGERTTRANKIKLYASGVSWTKSGNNGLFLWYNPQSSPFDLKLPTDSSENANLICGRYTLTNYSSQSASPADKVCYTTWTSAGTKYFAIYDTAYANATNAEFKQAMENNDVELCYELQTPVHTTETPQPIYTQKGYNVLEPISGDVQSANVNTTYLHLLGGLFARKADLVNGKVPDSQLPDFGEANVINFDSIVSGTTTIPSDDRTKLSDMTKPCEIHIGTAVYHRATPFKFYWEQKGTVLNVVKILEINSSTYIITETTMFASYATTSTNKGIPEIGTNGVWKLVANKTVASDASNTGFTYTELLGGNYDEYMVVVKGKAKGNVSILNTNSGGTSLSNTITYREGASASISNNQSSIPATNGNYFEATLTLKNYISFGSGNGGYFALDGNACDGDSTTQSTYFIQCAWKIAYAGTYAIGFNNLAKDSEIRLYGRNTGDYVFPNPL